MIVTEQTDVLSHPVLHEGVILLPGCKIVGEFFLRQERKMGAIK